MKKAICSRGFSASLKDHNDQAPKNERAIAIICTAVGDSSLCTIQDCDRTKAAWTELNGRYAGKLFNKLVFL